MESMEAWQNALAFALLHFVWQGAVIGVLYAALRPLTVSAAARLALGQAALLGMALCLPATVFALLPSAGGAALGAGPPGSLPAGPAFPSAVDAFDWASPLLAVWAGGVLLLGLRATGRWWMLQRLCRAALPASDALQAMTERMARELGIVRPVLLRTTVRLSTPVVVGCLRPVILLPAAIVLRLPQAQLGLLIAHELAHVRRWDFVLNLMQTAVEIVLFYHPVVHWISRQVRQDRELCCDDLVGARFGNHLAYARALLAVAEFDHQPAPRFAVAATGGVLMPRIERILAPTQSPRRRYDRIGGVALVATALTLALALDWRERNDPGPIQLSLSGPLAGFAQPLELTLPALAFVAESGLLRGPDMPLFAEAEAVAPPLPAVSAPVVERGIARYPAVAEVHVDPPPIAAAALADAQFSTAASEPELTAYRAPDYPKNALNRGVEGEVTVEFSINREGRVVDVRLLGIEPAREVAFGTATRQAMQHWRFSPPTSDLGRQRRVVEFRLDGMEARGRCPVQTGSHFCRDGG